MRILPVVAAVTAAFLVVACSSPTPPKGVTVVNNFDAKRYLGTWYEIARFDHRFERGLDKVTATYSLRDDGGINVINKGYNPDREMWQKTEGKAYFTGDPSRAALKVSFFGPFYGGYNVIALDREYRHALVCGNELKRLGEWDAPNPLENVRQFRTEESEMAYLTGEQIDRLLEESRHSSAKDLELIVRICLSTGARWGEAEKLKRSQITAGKVTFIKTKGKRNRTIPLDPKIIAELPKKNGTLFSPCYYAFRSALERARIDLPAGQLTHVLRHTFASHFMMNGGNILVLQKILGHTDIKMTMRYAHFAPNHLEEALKLNPLNFSGKYNDN
ncbi:hypothetical protein DDU43_18880 [Salmonella enterica]|nr:hypothetical protein [Salmonella enterica]